MRSAGPSTWFRSSSSAVMGAGLAVLAVAVALVTASGSAEATPAAGAATGHPDPNAPVTLAFGGDVHFEGRTRPLLGTPETGLASLRPYLAPADVAMVNLETAVTERGTPAPKEYRFRTPASAFTALAGAGVDVVTMANNHAVDYGAVGLADTLAARRTSPVRVVGIGENSTDAYAPAIFDVRGRRVAVLGASQLRDWTLQQFGATRDRPGIAGARPIDRLLAAVRSSRRSADVVVVYLHWGTEKKTCPDAVQRDAAKALIAAGADVVVGAHAHVVQGAGWLGRGYVAYGLGNFVWYSRSSDAAATTGVLTLTVEGRRVTRSRWTPLRIGANGVPAAPPAATARAQTSSFEAARSCTGLSRTPSP